MSESELTDHFFKSGLQIHSVGVNFQKKKIIQKEFDNSLME